MQHTVAVTRNTVADLQAMLDDVNAVEQDELEWRIESMRTKRRDLQRNALVTDSQESGPSGCLLTLTRMADEGELLLIYYSAPLSSGMKIAEVASFASTLFWLKSYAKPVIVQAPGHSLFIPDEVASYNIPFLEDSDLSIGNRLGCISLSLATPFDSAAVFRTVVEGFAVCLKTESRLRVISVEREKRSRCAGTFRNLYHVIQEAEESMRKPGRRKGRTSG